MSGAPHQPYRPMSIHPILEIGPNKKFLCPECSTTEKPVEMEPVPADCVQDYRGKYYCSNCHNAY